MQPMAKVKAQSQVVLNIKIAAPMKAALAKAAARDGQSSSSIVRKLIADFLRAEGSKK
jgi:hypothetical protein